MSDKCRSCPAPVLWANHKKTNQPNPLDPEPTADGNLLVTRSEQGITYEVLTGDELTKARAQGFPLYVSHFATCPNSKQHRKARAAAATAVDVREAIFGPRKEATA
jgi:hypothetical protein